MKQVHGCVEGQIAGRPDVRYTIDHLGGASRDIHRLRAIRRTEITTAESVTPTLVFVDVSRINWEGFFGNQWKWWLINHQPGSPVF